MKKRTHKVCRGQVCHGKMIPIEKFSDNGRGGMHRTCDSCREYGNMIEDRRRFSLEEIKIRYGLAKKSCKCGCTENLLEFRGENTCPACLNRDLEPVTADTMAQRMSMVGNGLARIQETW